MLDIEVDEETDKPSIIFNNINKWKLSMLLTVIDTVNFHLFRYWDEKRENLSTYYFPPALFLLSRYPSANMEKNFLAYFRFYADVGYCFFRTKETATYQIIVPLLRATYSNPPPAPDPHNFLADG